MHSRRSVPTNRSPWTARPCAAPVTPSLILVVKGNQPALHAQLRKLPWKTVPAATHHDRGHGRQEQRTLQAVTVPAGLAFPHAAQALRVTRRTRPLSGGKWRSVTVYTITSLDAHQATHAQLAAWIRGHWQIEALVVTESVSPAAASYPAARAGQGRQDPLRNDGAKQSWRRSAMALRAPWTAPGQLEVTPAIG